MPSARIDPRSGVADLGGRHKRRPIAKAGGRCGAANALGGVLIDFVILVRPRPEALHRRQDHARVQLLDAGPAEPHAVERPGREILDENVASFDQSDEGVESRRVLGVERNRALVVVQHGEVEAVCIGNVAKLPPRDVAAARPLDLDHVCAKPREKLRAGWPRLHMREVEDFHSLQGLRHLA